MADFVGRFRRLVSDPQYLPGTKREPFGESKIDGRRVVGYRVVDNRKIQTLWVEPDSLLPVQIEEISRLSPDTRTVYTDFAFNVALDQSLFSLDPPAGYTVVARTAPRPATEKDLIELFCQFRDHGQHMFPDTVDVSVVAQMRRFEEAANGKLSHEQRHEMVDKIVQGATFVAGLPSASDAHYAGKGVKAAATDAPIFWYRPEGKQKYRLIRADLSVVEVAASPRIAGVQAIDAWSTAALATRRPAPNPGQTTTPACSRRACERAAG